MNRGTIQTRLLVLAGWAVIAVASPVLAQQDANSAHAKHSEHAPSPAHESSDVLTEIAALRAQVAQLQAMLQRGHGEQAPSDTSAMGSADRMMSGMGDKKRMKSGMGGGGGEMKGMSGGGMQGMGDMNRMMSGMGGDGMKGMSGGGMQGMMGKGPAPMAVASDSGELAVRSDLPGFPGASHIYHIGATGFFLDHPEHIDLSTEQITRLNEMKTAAMLEQSGMDRRIEEQEEVIWSLTGAAAPNIGRIEEELLTVGRLRAGKRLAFIRAVGEAAQVLTQEQRDQLIGLGSGDMPGQTPR
ncbi:MAG: hypothetical protein KF757_12945 [Phycisphaeraceae bacterium]|nr:hypothetical protein [Phycisphaeraceae bacterium]